MVGHALGMKIQGEAFGDSVVFDIRSRDSYYVEKRRRGSDEEVFSRWSKALL